MQKLMNTLNRMYCVMGLMLYAVGWKNNLHKMWNGFKTMRCFTKGLYDLGRYRATEIYILSAAHHFFVFGVKTSKCIY